MIGRVFVGIILLTMGAGCRSYLPYAGRPMNSTASARRVIYETLDQQPTGVPLEIDVTDERFRIQGSRSRMMRTYSELYATSIYYSKIGDVVLSEKRGLFTVTILAANRDMHGATLLDAADRGATRTSPCCC